MRYFDTFVSGSVVGSGVQSFFFSDPERPVTGRVYYRLAQSGEYQYSLLFSNAVDTTFADGGHSRAGRVLDEWRLLSMRAGICRACSPEACVEPEGFRPVLFDGKEERWVRPGELFASDPFPLAAEKGDCLCVETVCAGRTLPCHPESLLPAFVLRDGKWIPSKEQPFLSMLGCARPARSRVGLLGDSITQGIGTPENSHRHLSALLADRLGPEAAVWNLGLGFACARDAALDGMWLYKARQNDLVCLCLGVNDLLRGRSAVEVQRDLATIVRALRQSGVKVLLETIPPFDYAEDVRPAWEGVNAFLRGELAKEADALFDVVPVLGRGPETPHLSRYGAHPDERGNAAWAEALAPAVAGLLRLG